MSQSPDAPTGSPPPVAHRPVPEPGRGLLAGRIFGVPIYVAPSWFVVAALITVFFAGSVEARLPGLGPWRFAVSLSFAVLLYASVFLHELSHTLMALRYGVPVRRITIQLLGGASELTREPDTPRQELAIAAVGPVVNLALGLIGAALLRVLPAGTVVHFLAVGLTSANVLVGAFNLLPGLPLDGGRMLQAAVWRATGRRTSGLLAAGWAGRVVAAVVLLAPFAFAVWEKRTVDLVGVVWAALLGSMLWAGATDAIRGARVRERLPAVHARRLARPALPVPADLPLAEALRRAGAAGARALVVVDGGGNVTGIVNEAAVAATPEQRRPWLVVGDLARALEPALVLPADLAGEPLLRALEAAPASEYLLVDSDGSVQGVLASADVDAAFADI